MQFNKNTLIFIIVALLLVGIVFFYGLQPIEDATPAPEDTGQVSGDMSLSAIEKELTEVHIEGADQEFADIDSELEAALQEAGR